MDKQKFIVEGFVFTEEAAAQKAYQEAESIQYVKNRIDMENPRMVLEMYHKLIAEHVFETPVGIMYLKELRDYLSMLPEMKGEKLEPIETAGMIKGLLPSAKTEAAKEAYFQGDKASEIEPSESEEGIDWYVEKLEQSKQKERAMDMRRSRAEKRLKESRKYLRFSMAGNLFLLIVAVGMLVITMMDEHPNIINYENKIIDKYAEWEQELTEREQTVKEQEQKLGLTP